MTMKTYDKILGSFFILATIVMIVIFFTNNRFFDWAFTRHQNILSWYIRPLFTIPIVIGAFKKSYTIIFGSIFGLFTSMFWFPKPAVVSQTVKAFLEFEKGYLTTGWSIDKIFVVIAVILFFTFLICATWCRKWSWVFINIVVCTILKMGHSVIFGEGSGLSIVKPAILGVVICTIAIWVFFKKRKAK